MLGLVCSDPGPVPQQFCSACHLYLGSNGMIMIWPGRNHNPYQETIKLSGVFGVAPRTRHSGLYITNTLWSGNSTPAVSESWSVHIPHKVSCTKLPIQFEKNIQKTAQIVGYVSHCISIIFLSRLVSNLIRPAKSPVFGEIAGWLRTDFLAHGL